MSETRPWEFPALRRRVRIATQDGEMDGEGVTLGGLAVTPAVEGKFFVVTHLASGRLVGRRYGFTTEADAVGAMRSLVAMPVDWRVEAPDPPHGFSKALVAVFRLWAAFVVVDALDHVEGHA